MHNLSEQLSLFNFSVDSPAAGLLFVGKDYHREENVSFDQILVLDKVKALGASAVYFRQIEGRSSVPQILIFDNSNNSISPDDLIDIHRKIWSSDIVPLYYVFNNTDVRIFNSRKSIDIKTFRVDPLDTLPLDADLQTQYKKYSASLFENGSFWELPENKKQFSADTSSYNMLVKGLNTIRKEFVQGQNEIICNKLLVLSILVKYLEERIGKNGKKILPEGYFKKYDNSDSFCDVLRKKKCIALFQNLSKEVNGGIFKLTSQEENQIEEIDQSVLADFLDGNKVGKQLVFWRLYDFNYLPVELISRIYEEFIPVKRKDIAYTPAHLVNFIIDECMPISSPRKKVKVIDVSCGSGIFLVTAFRRLVQWWQEERYNEKGEISNPNIATLKSILSHSIYGVDLEPEAVRVAKFSLTIALCDMLDPARMWEELTEHKLLNLDYNLISKDFFDYIKDGNKFDYVVGNPPFNPPKNDKEDQNKYWNELESKVDFDWDISSKSIALAFMQKAMSLLNKNGLLAMVMPSGPLLYNNTMSYRSHFLSAYNVPQIFDFSCLSSVLFDGPNVSISVMFAENKEPDNNDILHAVVKRTETSKEKLYFEIDKYDLHYVPKEIAKTDQLVWKANLLGGSHLFYLLKRMEKLRTIGEYLEEKKRIGWVSGTGYFVGNKSKKALHLTNKEVIPTSKFNKDSIDDLDIEIEEELFFEGTRERNKKIFIFPHILIKANIGLPIVLLDKKDLIFQQNIIGIYAPETELKELSQLEKNFKQLRDTYKTLLMLTSGRVLIGRATSIKFEDILRLPYPEGNQGLRLSEPEKVAIEDVSKYKFKQVSEGENAKVNIQNAKSKELQAFGKTFCKSLNSIYEEESKQFYPLDTIEADSFICYPFAYGNPEKPKVIAKKKVAEIERGNLDSLIDNPQGSVLYKRVITLYAKDMVYLIKPKTLKYWLKSIALRDASEVFDDLVSNGY